MIFTSTDFTGHYPVPVAAVVVADSEEEARQLLNDALRTRGLPGDVGAVQLVEDKPRNVIVLSDGEY